METIVAESIARQRFTMILFSGFAAVALLLASVGIYGVLSYVVGQRTQEIGIRMALGAQRGDVLRAFLRDGARLTLIGIAAGAASALGAHSTDVEHPVRRGAHRSADLRGRCGIALRHRVTGLLYSRTARGIIGSDAGFAIGVDGVAFILVSLGRRRRAVGPITNPLQHRGRRSADIFGARLWQPGGRAPNNSGTWSPTARVQEFL